MSDNKQLFGRDRLAAAILKSLGTCGPSRSNTLVAGDPLGRTVSQRASDNWSRPFDSAGNPLFGSDLVAHAFAKQFKKTK